MNRNILNIFCMAVVLTCSTGAWAYDWLKSENSDAKEGNAFLSKKENAKALASYDKAAKSLPNRGEVHLNRGLALSRLKEDKTDEAMQAFTLAADSDAPKPVLARAEFNLGNAFLKKEDYKAAIEHYKKSLMLAPGNQDAAWNLEVARLKKKQQEEQQKQDQENQDQQNQGEDGDSGDQDQQEKQDQEKQDQQNKDGQDQQKKEDKKEDQPKEDEQKQKEEDQQKQAQQDQEKNEQQAPPQNQSMEQMLNALDREDNDFHKNKARQRAVGVPANVKDW